MTILNVSKRPVLTALVALPVLAALIGWFSWPSRPEAVDDERILAEGITYTRRVLTEPRRLMFHTIEIDLTVAGRSIMVTPPSPKEGHELSAATVRDFAKTHNAQVAINGSFFEPFEGSSLFNYYPQDGDPVNVYGLTISNGEPYSTDSKVLPVFCVHEGKALITRRGCPKGTQEALAGRPLLVWEGRSLPATRGAAANRPSPRTAVGINKDGTRLWMFAVDGRQEGYSNGVTLPELAGLVRVPGVHTALNLDGGGSTTMVGRVSDKVEVLNSPIHTRIPMRERPVANHLGVVDGL